MINRGITAFYGDDLLELKNEFKEEFNSLTDSQDEGLYTFMFSSYHEYIITTEIVYCMVYEKTALFFVTPYAMQVRLDNNLMVTGGDVNPVGETFEALFIDGDKSSLIHIGECCNSKGYTYGIYAFDYTDALNSAIEKVNNGDYSCEALVINDDLLLDVSIDYLDIRIQKFQEQVERSQELEEPIAGLDENPYANAYYDNEGKAIQNRPLNQSERLGDHNV